MNILTEYLRFLHEGYLLSDKTISVNLSRFESRQSNKLLILGMAGAGKTTLGKLLSKKYKVPLMSTDRDFKSEAHIYKVIRNNERLIIEGIDLVYSYKFPMRRRIIVEQPMIILGMAALRAGIRAGIRNKNAGMSATEILRLIKTNIQHLEKPMKLLRNDLMKNPNNEIKEYKIK